MMTDEAVQRRRDNLILHTNYINAQVRFQTERKSETNRAKSKSNTIKLAELKSLGSFTNPNAVLPHFAGSKDAK